MKPRRTLFEFCGPPQGDANLAAYLKRREELPGMGLRVYGFGKLEFDCR